MRRSEVYRNEGNYDVRRSFSSPPLSPFRRSPPSSRSQMAFVRVATVLKLLKEVLPFHHPDWRTLTAAQLDSVRQVRSLFFGFGFKALSQSLSS